MSDIRDPSSSSTSSSRRGRTGNMTVGSFIVENQIGKGSFATVYSGHHSKDGSIVAIKSVNLTKLNKKLRDNLYSEIDILKGLQHPHIVALMDCRESTSHIHLITELCELGDLSMFIRKRDKHHTQPALADMARKYPSTLDAGVNEVIVRSFLKQLASALSFLRDRNFIHRDIKPQNILLSPSPLFRKNLRDAPKILSASETSFIPNAGLESLPMLKIADFGFARALPLGGMADTLCGSPLYMAPEILRYEKYDAKADLWSVGTVLFEMMTGKPPFRASNHVELLRRIEQTDDRIKYPEKVSISPEMKNLMHSLLKRHPVERMTFPQFFLDKAVTDPIPNLVGDDVKERRLPIRRSTLDPDRLSRISSSPTGRPSSSLANEILASPEAPLRLPVDTHRHRVPAGEPTPRRPVVGPSATAPNKVQTLQHRSSLQRLVRQSTSPESVPPKGQSERERFARQIITQELRAAQDVADEREYVVVHKGAVFANSLADELAADPRLAAGRNGQSSSRPVHRERSNTVPSNEPASQAVQIVRNSKAPVHHRQNSYERRYGPSPDSATLALGKALHGASVRLFGVGVNLLKGQSTPPLYSPFPSFSTTKANAGLIEDKPGAAPDNDDYKAVHDVEDSATISDVVYCFAEVKYKQLVPLAPSTEHGLGGLRGKSAKPEPDAQLGDGEEEQDDGLSVDAVVTVCEEALVLYVKALSLLAKALDIAGAWWERKGRGTYGSRMNSAVQWVRNRFNEVLEKAEFVRMKLIEAQRKLPEDHPGHPNNHENRAGATGASTEGVHLSSGVTAEKILYERATEMCRHAAVDEISNEDLQGCEVSYNTALRLLEAVLENDEDLPAARKIVQRDDQVESDRIAGLDTADRQIVEKMAEMIRKRLHALRKKIAIIAKHQALPHAASPRSSSGGITPTIISTPPK